MGYVPEDRHHEGIVPSFSVKENLVLKDVGTPRFSAGPLPPARRHRARTPPSSATDSTSAAPPPPWPPAALSGGNIQKVILARELARGPQGAGGGLPHPRRGHGRARSSSTRSCSRCAARASGILLVSEELEEIMNLSDRIAVIYKGRILEVVPATAATRERLGRLMAGVEA